MSSESFVPTAGLPSGMSIHINPSWQVASSTSLPEAPGAGSASSGGGCGEVSASPLRANPNALECLYTTLVEEVSPLSEELLAMRDCFLTKRVYQTYNGYVMSQFKKLGQDLRNKGAIRWKHAMHLVRLLLSGITILTEGAFPVRVGQHRERLLAIRRGELSWQEVNSWRKDLHREFDAAWMTPLFGDRTQRKFERNLHFP